MRTTATILITASLLGSAHAADYPLIQTPTASLYSGDIESNQTSPWQRPYVGIFGGVASASRDYTLATQGQVSSSAFVTGGGVDFGLRTGFDYAQDNFLIGAVADFSIASMRAGVTGVIGPLGINGGLESRIDNLGTLRIRTGFLPHRNVLAYVHGGGALATVSILENGTKVPGLNEQTRLGYAVGVGVEYAVQENFTLNTEYSYLNLGAVDLRSFGTTVLSEKIDGHRLTSGLNVRF